MKVALYVVASLLLAAGVYFGVVNRDKIAQWFGQVFSSRDPLTVK